MIVELLSMVKKELVVQNLNLSHIIENRKVFIIQANRPHRRIIFHLFLLSQKQWSKIRDYLT